MTQIALITGASRGLGAALARQLAPTHHIIAVAKTVGALEELDDAIQAAGGAATLAPMDITVDAAMQQLCRGIFDRWGKIDMWLHTAVHAAPLAPAGHIGPKDLTKSMAINVEATARLIAYVSPFWARPARPCSLTTHAAGSSFSALTAQPRPHRSPLPAAGRRNRSRPARWCRS